MIWFGTVNGSAVTTNTPLPGLGLLLLPALTLGSCSGPAERPPATPPNIVLVMADDMGWGQTGYYGHPLLETPHLDEMAAHGLRFDRFYAGAPNCSPTRATILTGRSNDRTGVSNHGFALRLQEKTLVRALRDAGYATGHFGKWHLNGMFGPGAPILPSDAHGPGAFGFDTWISVTNFFDRDPLMGHADGFEQMEGDSSEIIVDLALGFIRACHEAGQPFFAVIWYGTPHSPFDASEEDGAAFAALDERSRDHHGELVAMDRSIGALRSGLRTLGVAHETLVWFTSDNGGLERIEPDTTGGLRGFKNGIYEGGLRVPAVIEWPEGIPDPAVTEYPAVTMDIFPTLVDVAGLPRPSLLEPVDGLSLVPLFSEPLATRGAPIPFRHTGRGAVVDDDFKLVTLEIGSGAYELYNLRTDPGETTDLFDEEPEVARRLVGWFETWNSQVDASQRGADYPEGTVDPAHPERRSWWDVPGYQPFIEEWRTRPEFAAYLERARQREEGSAQAP